MKHLRKFSVFAPIAVLLCAAFTLGACSLNGRETLNTSTDVVQIPYTGNETISSDYVVQKYGDKNTVDLAQAYAETADSVVTVEVTYPAGSSLFLFEDVVNTGSGFFLTEDGYILTSADLFYLGGTLLEGRAEIVVRTKDGKSYDAQFIDYDKTYVSSGFPFGTYSTEDNSGFALIKADGQFEAVTLGNSEAVAYGEPCFTVSSLSDGEDTLENLIFDGVVSRPQSDRKSSFLLTNGDSFFDDSVGYLIQTSVAVNGGNEGAPLFNGRGEVIGVMSLSAQNTSTFLQHSSFGISFAVPSVSVMSFLREVEEHHSSAAGLCEKVACVDGDFTPSRADNLLLSEIGILNSSAAQPVSEILRAGEFAIASSGTDAGKVVLKSQGAFEGTFESAARSVAAAKLNATVKIVSASENGTSEGSGFLLNGSGYLATNLHVINKNVSANEANGENANSTVDVSGTYNYAAFDNVRVDGKPVLFSLELIAYDQREDLAVMRLVNDFWYEGADGSLVEGFENVCTLDTSVRRGEISVAIGNALGYGLSAVQGVVSQTAMDGYRAEYGHDFIQTDCPINSGNSGGPLFDADGNVIGVNSMGLSEDYTAYENISWAIPAQRLCAFLDEIADGSVYEGKIFLQGEIEYHTV